MPAMYPALQLLSPQSGGGGAIRSRPGRDQWVSTEYNGATVTGRVLAVLRAPGGETLYEIELPLMTRRGGMTRVVRRADEMHPVEPGD